MEKQNQIVALKSLSSMIISLLSIIGLLFTILVYSIVSPSVSSIQQSSSALFDGVVQVSDASVYNYNAMVLVVNTQLDAFDDMESALNSTKDGIRASRDAFTKISRLSGTDFSNETIRLKASEDNINQMIIEIQDRRESLNNYKSAAGTVALKEGLDSQISKSANEFSTSIASLSTLFTGLTVVLVLLFLSIILLSAEGLLG